MSAVRFIFLFLPGRCEGGIALKMLDFVVDIRALFKSMCLSSDQKVSSQYQPVVWTLPLLIPAVFRPVFPYECDFLSSLQMGLFPERYC